MICYYYHDGLLIRVVLTPPSFSSAFLRCVGATDKMSVASTRGSGRLLGGSVVGGLNVADNYASKLTTYLNALASPNALSCRFVFLQINLFL